MNTQDGTRFENCTYPNSMPFFVLLQETVKAKVDLMQHRGVTRMGEYATSKQDFFGLTYMSQEANHWAGAVTQGVFVGEVEPGATIAPNDYLVLGTEGRLTRGTTPADSIGRAADSSTGSTAANPHYIRVNL